MIFRIAIGLTLINFYSYSQSVEKVDIPAGIVYKYCDSTTYANAKEIVAKELTDESSFELCDKISFVGPVIWSRFKKVKSLKRIEGGNMKLLVDNAELEGKMTQNIEDTKKVWTALRKDIGSDKFEIRKPTPSELHYYWSVISFDIEEPMMIVETKDHKYIIDLTVKSTKLLWLDEVPF